ncbi:MAG: alkaline phosphatase D family protein [Wenzhouxiangellaceae bacterium]|nr:alkaline phosphatase D family protein [Wenzhouxiangellaceae bacterium]
MRFIAVLLLGLLSVFPLAAAEIVAGPMPGHSAMRAVKLWLQTDGAAEVALRYWPEGERGAAAQTDARRPDAERAYTLEFDINSLEPGTVYNYVVLIDGEPVEPRFAQHFRTQPLWQWRTDPPDFRFALGSCSYVNEPAYDRPGKPYGGDHQIYASIAKTSPDFMLWMGDNWYYREVDWDSRGGLFARASTSRQLPEMQPLLTATHHYATWDDHDFGPNNSDRSYPLREQALEVFDAFWSNPDFSADGTGGVTNYFEWHDAAFFLLDNRYNRDANERVAGGRQVFGEAQIEWLINALKFSRASFKFVVAGGQFLNSAEVFENLGHVAPSERQRILDAIDAEDIPGVIFLSGDRHHSVLLRKERGVDYPLHDWTVSPLTAGPSRPFAGEGQYRVEGSVYDGRAFGLVAISGPREDRVATLTLNDSDGQPVWSTEIRASELRP